MIRIFMVGYSDNKGGVETYITNINNHLDHSEFDVIYTMPTMVIDGKKWIRPQNRHNYIKYSLFWRKFFKETHIDVLYYNTCDVVSIDSLKFAKKAGVPVRIIHSHNTGNQNEIDGKLSLFHRLSEKHSRRTLHKYATHLFACSDVAGDWMFDGRKYTVIKNGIDLEKYKFNEDNRKKCREQIGVENEKLIGVIGRLSPVKNPYFVLSLAKEIIKKSPDTKIVMIGDGEIRAEVEQKIKEENLRDTVILTGAVDNVNEWLSAMDCILMPSLFEGLPFALVEAQANGLPGVVSAAVSEEANIGGILEYVDLKQSPEYWAEKVINAAKKGRTDVSRKLIEAGYSIKDTADTVSKIIEESYGRA